MRVVQETAPGVVELNWVWLPTWLGQNTAIKKEIEDHMRAWMSEQGPLKLNDETLDRMHVEVLNFLREKFPNEPCGLIKYLEGLAHVQYGQEG